MVADLKAVYQAPTEDARLAALEVFAARWDMQFLKISSFWRNNWTRVRTLFDYPDAIRKLVYTTNAIESLNNQLRKVIRTRCSFPTDEATIKLLYLALKNATKKWNRPRNWLTAYQQLCIIFPERIPDEQRLKLMGNT